MKRLRIMSAAALVATLLAFAPSSLEAKTKTGGDGMSATCAYLLSIINYPYVSPVIQSAAISMYYSLGCPALP